MNSPIKPTLYPGYRVSDTATVKSYLERVYFAEIYSLAGGGFLYLYKQAQGEPHLQTQHQTKTVTIQNAAYSAVTVQHHTREQVAFIAEELTTLRGLACVAGMTELKALLIKDVISPLRDPEKYRQFKLTIPNGVLLYGPPGCGKTFIVKKLAEELRYKLFEINPSSVGTPYVHGAVGNIAKVFEIARQNGPSIIFIDEIEGLIPKREDLGGHADIKKEEINEFLLQLNNASADNILVIGATNRPNMIDTAILRSGRMDKRIYIPPPDFEAREEMFRLCLNGRPYTQTIDFKKLAMLTVGYVGSDLELIVTEAAREAVTHDMSEINEAALVRAISKVTPSISQRELEASAAFVNLERW